MRLPIPTQPLKACLSEQQLGIPGKTKYGILILQNEILSLH